MGKTSSALESKNTIASKPNINKLAGKHFIAWIRRQIREHGKGFEVGYIGDHHGNPVEAWLSDLRFEHVSASSMLELRVDDREFTIVPNGSFMDFLMFCDTQPDEESDWSLWTETEDQVYYRPITAKECLQAALDNINPEAALVISEPKAAKEVQIIARYEIKKDRSFRPLIGHVAYLVRSSDGQSEYCTTLVSGKATGCTCPARKPCYHMKQLEVIEAARVTKNVRKVSAKCTQSDQNVPTECPIDANLSLIAEMERDAILVSSVPFVQHPLDRNDEPDEEFSQGVAARWTEDELSTSLSREAYEAIFDVNHLNSLCYA